MSENKFELIVSIVNRGFSDGVVNAARNCGAGGGTIIYGRGTSKHEKDSFLGISIQPEKELILTLTTKEKRNTIIDGICKEANIEKEGVGICFSLPVNQVRGISVFKNQQENK